MGRRDYYSKRLLDNPKVVSDIFHYLISNSDSSVSLKEIQHLDGEQITIVGKKLDRRIRDRLWLVTFTFAERTYQHNLGIEQQSESCYGMPVRVMHYDALSYTHQLKALIAQHRQKAAHLDHATFLSGIAIDDKLIPVVTVVLYFGKSSWRGAIKLSDMLVVAPCRSIQALIHAPDMQLIDPHRLSIQQLIRFQSELREILAFIKYADDRKKLMRLLDRHCQGRTISGDAIDVINAFTKAKIKQAQKKEDIKMCQAIIELKQIAREEGKREGKREGKQEGKLETLLSNIRSLCKTTGWSYEEAMKALRIPKVKREALLKMLPTP